MSPAVDTRNAVWGLWSEYREGQSFDYSGDPRPVERLPRDADISPDGRFATVWRGGRAVAVYMNLGPRLDSGRRPK